jgi:DNA-binding Lrp family transcriptional regulator
MAAARRARFERCHSIPHIRITPRDINILAHLDRHRLLRSREISQLVNGSPQQILRRLQLLFHHGYVDRPRSQIEYFYKGGSQPLAYSLSPHGIALVREHFSQSINSSGFEKRNPSPLFLRHALQKSEIMVALELACRRNPEVTFVSANALASDFPDRRLSLEWRVKVDNKTELGVIPDDVFALEYSGRERTKQRVLFFVESDRSTMPVERRDLSKTSFRRKLLAYEATWLRKIHQTRFSCNRFRVLTITTSADRVKRLVESCSKLKHGLGLFLFTDLSILKTDDVLTAPWQTAYGCVARLADG